MVKSVSLYISKKGSVPFRNRDNYIKNESILDNFKLLIIVETFFGINRLHVYYKSKVLMAAVTLYQVLMMCLCVFAAVEPADPKLRNVTRDLFSYTLIMEYFCLIINNLFIEKNQFIRWIEQMNKFDTEFKLTPCDDLKSTSFKVIMFGIIYFSAEYIVSMIGNYVSIRVDFTLFFMSTLTHNAECGFFCLTLKSLYLRIKLLKLQLRRTCNAMEQDCEKETFQELMYRKRTVSELHQIYDCLHEACEKLTRFYNVPGLTSLISAAVINVILMTSSIRYLADHRTNKTHIVGMSIRVLTYTTAVVVTAFYSNIIKGQVEDMKTILYDTITMQTLDKIERRKVKAFLTLCRENDFSIAVCGLVKMDMALPLHFIGICITYSVITIQFFRFLE